MASKCKFRKKDGKVVARTHSPEMVCVSSTIRKEQRVRRAGGVKRSQPAPVLPLDTPDHPLASPKDVSQLLANSINQLRRGELDPRVANSVGYLATILLRALEQGPLEERIAKLEAMLGLAANLPSNVISDGNGPRDTSALTATGHTQ
jgi:hypothetical protein